MSIEESKQLIRRFYTEVVDGGDYSNLDSFVAADYVDHNAAEESGRGPEVVRTHLEAIRMTLPDFTIQIEDIFAEGDHVITRVTGRGTHLGEWMGIKPTGREVRLKGSISTGLTADGLRSIGEKPIPSVCSRRWASIHLRVVWKNEEITI
jgi:predicted ester cyclase